AGNITINARDIVSFSKGSRAYTDVTTKGNGGDINITTGSLFVSDRDSLLASSTKGEGNAGNITINARDTISFDGGSAYTDVGETSIGRAGNLNITSGLLSVTNGAQLLASTKGEGNAGNVTINTGSLSVTDNSFLATSANGQQGNAGNITINARDIVSFSKGSRAYTDVTTKGNGGDINIITGSLFVSAHDSLLASSTKGEGNAGNITINARDTISFDGGSAYTDVAETGIGQAGNLNITSESLSLRNRAQLLASTKGEGNAGNVTINTGSLSVTDNSFLAASANGPQGNAGNITINARDTVSFFKGSRAYTDVTTKGNGGDINIITGSLFVSDRDSLLASSTKGEGNAGNITINARDTISFDGGSAYTDVGETGIGRAGNLNITSKSLSVINGAQLLASTKNEGNAGNIIINTGSLSVVEGSFLAASANGQQGNAGNIIINARAGVLFNRAGQVYTNVTGTGNGGTISIITELLTVTNGSQLSASTLGVGNAGNLTFNTGSFFVTNNSLLSASSSGVGNAGNITINTGSLSVANESFLASSANGQGNAGNITIDARDTVSFENGAKVYTDVNLLPFISTIAVKGDGGDIKISSGSLLLTNGAQLISNTQGEGDAGDITINTGSLSVTNESFLASSANGQRGNAGDITINAGDRVFFDKGSAFSNVGVCSLIAVGCTPSNNTIKGNGGDIIVKAPSLQLINGSFLATGVGDDELPGNKVEGNGGNISIYLTDDLLLDQSFITTRLFTNGKGKAGDIDIRAGSVSSYQSLISASTQGQGNAGGVSVQTTGTISLVDSDISTAVQKGAIGDAQGINITARSLLLTDGAQLNAVTSGEGKAGNILIKTTDISVSGTNTTVAPTNLFQNNIPPRFNSPPKFVDGVESGIFTSTNSSGVGGEIAVNTNTFSISNGSLVDARTTASGRGGAIRVNTNTFEALSGGQLSAITSGSGTAGSITLNATGSVTIRDSDPTYLTRLAQFASEPTDIYGKLRVGNQGSASRLTASSAESGSAGDLTVQANSIRLDNGAKISADTTGGGGNIFLNSPLLLLRRGSSITTNASGDNITGGNITIDARNGFIIAVPSENSDIRADSENFRGGNITINNAAGIFGIQPKNEPSLQTSDITVRGATPDLSGRLQINSLDIDPRRGLVPLTIDVVDVASLVDDNICAQTANSSFTYIGRGGLPPSPNNTLNSDAVWEDWRLVAVPWGRGDEGEQGSRGTGERGNNFSRPTQIVEAQGWIIDKNGEVTLTAYAPVATPHKVGSSSHGCQPPIAK
ncbi:beta strand repeat-containing protein, partial [Scytonema sp. NUACC26]|uniref:beta strand repeat-containing protein n=1 Tax=Scytonema sp. NUACC26 TaxID=3140176 RepID=UPI0038B38DA2